MENMSFEDEKAKWIEYATTTLNIEQDQVEKVLPYCTGFMFAPVSLDDSEQVLLAKVSNFDTLDEVISFLSSLKGFHLYQMGRGVKGSFVLRGHPVS